MGYRLSKIYTRKGDDGTTGMADGSRISKDSLRMHVIGEVDELNSMLGIVVNKCKHSETRENLFTIQHDLFNLGGQLAMPDFEMITQSRVQWLESTLDKMNDQLEPLEEFILPGGAEDASFCQMARVVCRRTERSIVSLNNEEAFSTEIMAYINRLSDWLFVACRILNKSQNIAEIYWHSERIKSHEG